MDPQATLDELRRIALEHLESDDSDLARMAELVEALDGWLSTGGFLPRDWQARRQWFAT